MVRSDPKRNRRLVRMIDRRIIPLCAWLYLLNYLDRGNIGNAKVLNSEAGHDLLQATHMTTKGYAITLTLFSIAYSVFDVRLTSMSCLLVSDKRALANVRTRYLPTGS